MRSPSSRVLKDTADVYLLLTAQDADAGTDPSRNYASVPAFPAVRCGAQYVSTTSEEQGDGRVTTSAQWIVFISAALGLKIRDRLNFTQAGKAHQIYVVGEIPAGGREQVIEVFCEERL